MEELRDDGGPWIDTCTPARVTVIGRAVIILDGALTAAANPN